ncbi:MAG TPA: universal stress protein [Gemmatimonadales bacterium]|nr:universal stress protein [Gemmatimonadales bacterium]
MAWQPVVVGVDDSPAAAGAAALGWRLAAAAGTSCHLVHVVHDPGTAFASMMMPTSSGELAGPLRELVGPRLRAALGASVPPQAFGTLAIRIGRPAMMLKLEAEKLGAGLVLLGGKHHLALRRWLGSNTARDAARLLNVPVLVTKGAPARLGRVLVGVDLSYAAEPTIREAERFARLAATKLRAIHVLEPLTSMPELAQFVDQRQFNSDRVAILEDDIWPLLGLPGAERTMRAGDPAVALTAEAAEWQADLLVVGSHGKGWVDRQLLGSTTERLLDQLPVSLLVVPVHRADALPKPGETPEARRHPAATVGTAP